MRLEKQNRTADRFGSVRDGAIFAFAPLRTNLENHLLIPFETKHSVNGRHSRGKMDGFKYRFREYE